jgi:hypothetical protein
MSHPEGDGWNKHLAAHISYIRGLFRRNYERLVRNRQAGPATEGAAESADASKSASAGQGEVARFGHADVTDAAKAR